MMNIMKIYKDILELSENNENIRLIYINSDSENEFLDFIMIFNEKYEKIFKISKDSKYYIFSEYESEDLFDYFEIFRINSNYISNNDIIIEFIERYLKFISSKYRNSEKYENRFDKFRKSLENELRNLKIEYHNEFIQIIFDNELIFQINEFIFEDDYEIYIDLIILSIYSYLLNIKDRIF